MSIARTAALAAYCKVALKQCWLKKTVTPLELARYVVLNPLRAKLVRRIEQWPWSSYRATGNLEAKSKRLTADFVLAQFGATSTFDGQIGGLRAEYAGRLEIAQHHKIRVSLRDVRKR